MDCPNPPPKAPLYYLKGLKSFGYRNPQALLDAAQKSIYWWWWKYARLSPVFWYASTNGVTPQERSVARAHELMGDLSHSDFGKWFFETGVRAFAEPVAPLRVQLAETNESLERHQRGESLIVEVPLSITQKAINYQFRSLLKKYHLGHLLNVAEASQAPLKLHTKQFRLQAIENGYWVLLYRLINPSITAARIGDRLRLAPQHKIRDTEMYGMGNRYYTTRDRTWGPHNRLMATTGRYLYKAQHALWHVERGVFPCFSKPSDSYPFGKRQHAKYLAMTARKESEPSPYHLWVLNSMREELVNTVMQRNGFQQADRPNESQVAARFKDFFEGTSDMLS